MRSLLLIMLASGCYGGGEGLSVYVPTYVYGSDVADCTPETCAIATGSTLELELEYYVSDVSYRADPERVTIEPEGVIETISVGDMVRVRALAAGDAAITFEQQGTDGVYSATQHFQVRDVASVDVVPVRDGSLALAPDDRLHVIDGGTITLRADRRGPAGEYLLGTADEPWTASAGATLSATGTTGTLQKLEVDGLGSIDVGFSIGTLPIDVVPVTDVTRAELRIAADDLNIVAGDGETLRVPRAGGFVYVLDAYDATGHYVAGSGAPGDITIDDAGVRELSVERTYAIDTDEDRAVTLKVGPTTSVVTIDFP